MKEEIVVICDKDIAYARCVSDYIEEGRKLPFQVKIITKVKDLELFLRQHKIEILLIAQSSYHSQLAEQNISQIFILQEGEYYSSDKITIKKYQPISKIIKEVQKYYYEKKPINIDRNNKNGTIIIGLYTPVKRCLQTSFALLLGQILGEHKKILCLNFEAYPAFSCIFNQTFSVDLSDMMYVLHHQEEKFLQHFLQLVVTVNGIDIIPPSFSMIDVTKVDSKDWIKLYELIDRYCDYNYIILDLSDSLQDLFEILRECDKIITIRKTDDLAIAKIDQYEKVLHATNYLDVLEKTIKIELPYIPNHVVEMNHLPYSNLVEYVEKLITEELRDV